MYFEWVQNNYNYYWSAEEVDQRLERIMVDAFQAVYKAYAEREEVDLRVAAYVVALERLAAAMKARGWV